MLKRLFNLIVFRVLIFCNIIQGLVNLTVYKPQKLTYYVIRKKPHSAETN
jgi:hypothetical protein